MRQRLAIPLAVASSVLLTACGGGGGDDPPPVTPLRAENYTDVSLQVVSSVTATGPVFDALAVVALATSDAGGPSCATFTATDVAPPGLSQGDSFAVVAKECVLRPGELPVNGGLTFTFNAVGTNSAVTMQFTEFTTAGLTLNGAALLSVNSTTTTLAYQGLTAVKPASAGTPARTVVYNHTMAFFDSFQTARVTGGMVVNGSAYQLSTPEDLTLGRAYPEDGRLLISDGRGARVRVTMSETGFTSELFLSLTSPVAATVTRLWSAL